MLLSSQGEPATTIKNFKVRQLKTFKTISIVSYLLIILMGQMIGIPFFWWLLLALADFWSIDQLFAFFAAIGLTISFLTINSLRTNKILLLDILSFVLLASTIIRRLTAVPIELFNYLAFIIPTIIFAVFYIVSIYFSVRQYLQTQKASVGQNKTAANIRFGFKNVDGRDSCHLIGRTKNLILHTL